MPKIRLGEVEIDIVHREVRTGTSRIHLSGIEQSLLYVLASRGGRVVTRDEIMDAIWGTDFVSESNIVDRHVRSLRVEAPDDYRHPRFIATVPGKGYRFIPTFSNRGWTGQKKTERLTRMTERNDIRPLAHPGWPPRGRFIPPYRIPPSKAKGSCWLKRGQHSRPRRWSAARVGHLPGGRAD